MWFRSSLLLLSSFSALLPHVAAGVLDDQTAASWTKSGTCAYFIHKFGKWSPLKNTCIEWCKDPANGDGKYSECDTTSYNKVNWDDPSTYDRTWLMKDDDGDVFVPCPCKCDNPTVEGLTEIIVDVVVEGLKVLDVVCQVLMSALQFIVEQGISMIPVGGQIFRGATTAIRAAKTFAENALDGASYITDWVTPVCGKPGFGVEDLFGKLTGAPDDMGTSLGCMRKKKGDCKRSDDKPDDKPSNKPDDNPPKTTKEEDKTTTKSEPASTSNADSKTSSAQSTSATQTSEASTSAQSSSSQSSESSTSSVETTTSESSSTPTESATSTHCDLANPTSWPSSVPCKCSPRVGEVEAQGYLKLDQKRLKPAKALDVNKVGALR